jgi:hypothetical protein
VHCYFQNEWKDALVRIWKTTFLVDHATGLKSGLIHAENIALLRCGRLIPDKITHNFLFDLRSLAKGCSQFGPYRRIFLSLVDFCVKNIQRNQRDVYHVDI